MVETLIAGNWKMNTDLDEAVDLVGELKNINIKEGRQVLICPPFISLGKINELLKDSSIKLGAQNFNPNQSGAYTGEVSGPMLKSVGVSYVILGHSERRQIFGESDQIVNEKLKSALDQGLKPILCVGESEDQRDESIHFDVVKEQITKALEGVSDKDFEDVVIAYEPIWAIGTGKTASAQDAEEMCKEIRDTTRDFYGEDLARNVQILYGGSVKADTISELMEQENINGALVGGASLDGKEFEQIINYE